MTSKFRKEREMRKSVNTIKENKRFKQEDLKIENTLSEIKVRRNQIV